MATIVSACTKHVVQGGDNEVPEQKDGEISIYLPSADNGAGASEATDYESKITSARIFFYGGDGADKDKLIKVLSTGDYGVSINEMAIAIKSGIIDITRTYKVVVVGNWTTGFDAAEFAPGSARTLLDNKVTEITAQIPTPSNDALLLMSGETLPHDFSKETNINITLVRQVVKLQVTITLDPAFIARFPNATFGDDAQSQTRLSVMNIPSFSFVMPRNMTPPQDRYIDYQNLVMAPTTTAQNWTLTTYIYENPVIGTSDEAKAKSTNFILQLPYKLDASSNLVTDNYYRFFINDTKDPVSPNKTVRNTFYLIAATVHGFGGPSQPVDGEVSAMVTPMPWTVDEMNDQIGGATISLSKQSVILEHNNISELICITDSETPNLTLTVSNTSKVEMATTKTGKVTTISLKAIGIATDNNIDRPDYATLTIKYKNLIRTVKISYKAVSS